MAGRHNYTVALERRIAEAKHFADTHARRDDPNDYAAYFIGTLTGVFLTPRTGAAAPIDLDGRTS